MNSFDVFDTLIARRYMTTHSIWQQMEKEFDIQHFASNRPLPDDGTRSFVEIYNQLEINGSIPKNTKQELIKREIELEIKNSFPIQANMDRVNDGDILISDMYLPGSVILQMVRAAGLNKQVTIYQSNAGKGNGTVWNNLKENPPALHLGDNHHTDYSQPRLYGINAELYSGSQFTQPEKFIHNSKLQSLAFLIREIRLRNNLESKYFELACQVNLPLIFVMLEQLSRSIGNRPIGFIGRDCQLMWRLYNEYYGTAVYIPFSRKVAYQQPQLAAEYIRTHTLENSELVDISSTGETWTYMSNYGQFNVKSVIYSDSEHRPYLPNTFSYITKNSVCGQSNLTIEVMNCGDHGYLNELNKIGSNIISAKFNQPDLPFEIIQATHYPSYDAVELSQFYKNSIRKELSNKTDNELADLFAILLRTISDQEHLVRNLKEFYKKEHEYHQQIIELRKKNESNN